MRICNLSSGSDGNLTYVEAGSTKILVDIGLSCRETETRLRLLKVNPEDIDAILITHEHMDHIKGLEVFANRYKTKVFVHENGAEALENRLKREIAIQTFVDSGFNVGDFDIQTTAVPHDVNRCTAYSLMENKKKISIITDLGHTTPEILQNLFGSSLVFLEANHDVDRLMNNPKYPIYLKNRIRGNNGHLSNEASAEAILQLVNNGTRQVVLSHLSTENNTPMMAFENVCKILSKNGVIESQHIKIDVASTVPKAIYVV